MPYCCLIIIYWLSEVWMWSQHRDLDLCTVNRRLSQVSYLRCNRLARVEGVTHRVSDKAEEDWRDKNALPWFTSRRRNNLLSITRASLGRLCFLSEWCFTNATGGSGREQVGAGLPPRAGASHTPHYSHVKIFPPPQAPSYSSRPVELIINRQLGIYFFQGSRTPYLLRLPSN